MSTSITHLSRWGFFVVKHFIQRVAIKVKKEVFGKQSHHQSDKILEDRPVERAAGKLGITVSKLYPGFLELSKDDKSFWYYRGYSIFDSAIGVKIAGNKYITNEILARHGYPVPRGRVFSLKEIDKAVIYFKKSGFKRAVVKPASSTHSGMGVHTYVYNARTLKKAVFKALVYDNRFIIEEYIEGNHYRLLFFRDKLLTALVRVPARIQADGKHSVKELITRENNRRMQKDAAKLTLWPIDVDDEVKETLALQGLNLRSVPEKGKIIPVRSRCNTHTGGEIYAVYEQVNDKTIEVCRDIMNLLKISLAGFDLITPDVGISITEQGIFNEINSTPDIAPTYHINNPEAIRDPARDMLVDLFDLQEN